MSETVAWHTRFRPGRAHIRDLISLALPVCAVQLGAMLMGVVDTIMIGHVSAPALAGVAVGNVCFFIIAIFGMGTLMALDPIVSQAIGAGDETAVARAVQRACVLALALGIVGSIGLLFAEPVLRLLRQPEEIIPLAATYCRVLVPGTIPFMLFIVLRQTLQAKAIVAPVVITMVIANIANAGLNYVLIFGKLGFPEMGVAGAAWATSISRFLLLGSLLVAAWRDLHGYISRFDRASFARAPLLRMLKLGAPIGLHHGAEYGAFAAIALFMGMLGTQQVAGHQIAINLASLTFNVPMGVAQAGAVLVGQAIGRGDLNAARRSAGAATLIGVGIMAVFAIIFLSIPDMLAAVYTTDVGVVAVAVALIPIAGVFQVFDGLQVVSAGLLRGTADTRVPMLVGLVGFWLVGMPVSLILGFGLDQGATGLWWGCVAGLGAVGLFLAARVKQQLTSDIDRVLIEDPAAAA